MIEDFKATGVSKETFLYSLLESWHKILKYFEKKEQTLGYEYRERTNIGFLAAAATKTGCIVLEEYLCDKKHGHTPISGRGDLWIKTPSNRKYQFEAKRIELNVRRKDFNKKVKEALELASQDVKKISEDYREGEPAGIVFVVPKIPEGYECNLENLKDELLDLKSLNADFCAVHFCKQHIPLSEQLPCVALVGKRYKW